MSLLSYLWPLGPWRPQMPPYNQEAKFMAGLLAEIGPIRTLIGTLDDVEAQRVVTRCGKYLRHALEEKMGYEAMDHLFQSAGLGPASHLFPDFSERRIMVTDKHDYGRQLTTKERLTDRAQRLDNVAKLIVEFGFDGIQSDQKKARDYLYDLRPETNRKEARGDE